MKKLCIPTFALLAAMLLNSCQNDLYLANSEVPELRYTGDLTDSMDQLYRLHNIILSEEKPEMTVKSTTSEPSTSNASFTFFDSTEGMYANWETMEKKSDVFSLDALSAFTDLASKTHGEVKVVVSSAYLMDAIKSIVNSKAVDGTDLVFLMDKTGSMIDDLEMLKRGMDELMIQLKQVVNLRLGMAFFGDKNVDGPNWFEFKSFENNIDDARLYLRSVRVSQGGDEPESVYDGAVNIIKNNFWRSNSKRIIILIGDAPPLQKPFSEFNLREVVDQANKGKVDMNFYPILVNNGTYTYEKPIEKPKLISMLYPNPAKDKIQLDFEKEEEKKISIFNVDGKRIRIENNVGKHWEGDVSDLPNGMYIMHVKNNDGYDEALRFLVER